MIRMHLVVYSGGMDSYTLLHHVINSIAINEKSEKEIVTAISFNYNQRHKIELRYASEECSRLGIEHIILPVPVLSMIGGSALTDSHIKVPEGHYAEPSMKLTVVPGRNTVMLALALAYAESLIQNDLNAKIWVYYGAHGGDHHIYPDCRPKYVNAMQGVYRESSEYNVFFSAPFLYKTKGGIAALGKSMKLDYSKAWSCYVGDKEPCGKCGACNERAEAMAFADIKDI